MKAYRLVSKVPESGLKEYSVRMVHRLVSEYPNLYRFESRNDTRFEEKRQQLENSARASVNNVLTGMTILVPGCIKTLLRIKAKGFYGGKSGDWYEWTKTECSGPVVFDNKTEYFYEPLTISH